MKKVVGLLSGVLITLVSIGIASAFYLQKSQEPLVMSESPQLINSDKTSPEVGLGTEEEIKAASEIYKALEGAFNEIRGQYPGNDIPVFDLKNLSPMEMASYFKVTYKTISAAIEFHQQATSESTPKPNGIPVVSFTIITKEDFTQENLEALRKAGYTFLGSFGNLVQLEAPITTFINLKTGLQTFDFVDSFYSYFEGMDD